MISRPLPPEPIRPLPAIIIPSGRGGDPGASVQPTETVDLVPVSVSFQMRRLGPPIAVFALAGFASASGMRVLDPLLPLMAADFNTGVSQTASVLAGFLLSYGLGQLGIGPLGDRMGKPRVACFAVFGYGLAMMVGALAWSLPALVGLRLLSGLFAGAVIPLLIAHIGDTVPYADRQATLGKFLTGQVFAAMITSPVSGIIGGSFGWRVSFVVLGALSIAIAMLMATGLGGDLWRAPPRTEPRGTGRTGYLSLLSHRKARTLLTIAFLDGMFLFGGAFPFVGAFVIETFGVSTSKAGLIVAGFGLGAFSYTRIARHLVRRLGEQPMLLTGGLLLAATIGGLAVAPGWPTVIPLQILMGLAFYMFHGVLQARATEMMPEARGTAVSAFALFLFLGQTAGSLSFAAILHVSGFRTAFGVIAACMLVLALWAGGLRRPVRSKPPK